MMVKSRRDKDGAGPNFGRKQLEIKLTVFFFLWGKCLKFKFRFSFNTDHKVKLKRETMC